MTRSERLLKLLDLLRNRRQATTAQTLAEKLDISQRTVYRDIEALRRQGADIRGEAGTGFLLYHDFLLPPLMFNENEIESLVLGIRWVVKSGDKDLAEKAQSALTKINAVLPKSLSEQLKQHALYPVGQALPNTMDSAKLTLIRQALREERKLMITYVDKQDNVSQRSLLPVNMGYFDTLCLLAAWCELREDFRHFRTERITHIELGEAFTPKRAALLKAWQAQEGITLQELNF